MGQKSESRIFGLDAMRASAMVLMLFHHFAFFFPAQDLLFRLSLFVGHSGIELFFVLSGFLIGGILFRTLVREKSVRGLCDFWWRRWFRTLPNYYLFLLINIGLAWWLGSGTPSLWKYWFFFQNLTTYPPNFFAESWSLAIEEWFYLFLPLLFFAAIRIAPRQFHISSLVIVIASIAAVTVARTMFIARTHPPVLTGVRMTVIYRLDACMFGVFAAWMKHFYPEIFQLRRPLVFASGILLLVIVILYRLESSHQTMLRQSVTLPLTSLGTMLLLPLLDNWRRGGRGADVVLKFSCWAYAIYLTNLPIRWLLLGIAPGAPALLLGCIFLFLSFLCAEFIFTFYEKPIMDLRDRSPFRVHRPVSAPRIRSLDA